MKTYFINRGLTKYLSGLSIASFGTGMYFVTMAWMLTELGGTTASLSLFLALSAVPGIVLSPWIGVIIDRWDRRVICVLADVFRATCLISMFLIAWLWELKEEHIYVLSFLLSVGERFYAPAASAMVREITSPGELITANSLSSIFLQCGTLLGTGLSGILIHYFGNSIVILTNGIAFLLSAMLVSSVRSGRLIHAASKSTSVLADFIDGFTYLRASASIRKIAAFQTALLSVLYTTNISLPLFTKDVLDFGAREFGFIDGAWAVGAILGGLGLIGLIRRNAQSLQVEYVFIGIGVSLLVFLTSDSLVQASVGYMLMGLTFVTAKILLEAALQEAVPVNLQGRVRSTISMGIAIVSLAVYSVVGYVGQNTPLRYVYAFLSLFVSLLAIGSLLAAMHAKVHARS
jgi:MFS family permease